MTECEKVTGLSCAYVDIMTDQGNVTSFTWWLTLAHGPKYDASTTMQFIILLIITIIAILANLIVLMVMTSNKKLMNIPTHQYTAAQNINYLWFISVSPMLLLARKAYTWTFSVAMCKMILYTFSVTTFIAIWLFAFISMDRHIHVVQSLRKSRLSKVYPRYPIVAILLLVVFSVLFYIPLIFYFQVVPVIDDHCTNATKCFQGNPDSDEPIHICASLWPSPEGALAWNIIMMFISYILPSIIICYNYWQIYSNVKKVKKRIRTRRKGNRVSKREMEIRVTMMCGMLVGLFIIMWTPIFIILFLVQFARVQRNDDEVVSSVLFYWIFCLTLANAMISPLVYAFMNKKFVKAWEDYRFPCMERCFCLRQILQKVTIPRIDPSSSENTNSPTHQNNLVDGSVSPKDTKNSSATTQPRQRSNSSAKSRKQEITVIVTPPQEDPV